MLAVLFVAAAIAAAGCETSSITSTGPDPVKCQVSVSTPPMMEAGGGNSSLAVTTQPECAWDVSTTASWISGLSPVSGQGTGNVAFRVAANEGSSQREGTIVINGEQARVSQRAPCRYQVTPASQTIATSGGDSSVSLSTAGDCAWTATSDVDWITLTSPGSGTGPAAIAFSVVPNDGPDRSGTISVAGQRATVIQWAVAPPPCDPAISPASQNIGAAGGTGTPITVSAPGTCTWLAESGVPWITITSGHSGIGNGSVTFTVATNTGSARTGTISIATRTFIVAQAASATPTPPTCTYSISPISQSAPATGGTGTVNVTTTAACAWTAVSNAAWITVASGAAGTGNGAVGFSAAANTGAARTGTLTVAGQTFTVSQTAGAAPCTYSISPTSQNVAAGASTGTVTVTTAAGCTWTADSSAPWVTVTSGASGTGNGSVGFTVVANTGAARMGTLSIAGQTFTVNQAAFVPPPCTYTISPTSQSVAAGASTGSATVTTAAGCTWTSASNAPWIAVTSGATGTGNGSAAFSIAANTGVARTGTLTIAGHTFTVNQAAFVAPCTYSISPTSQTVPAVGGTGTVAVTTTSGCAWTASSNAPWITVTSGATGTGNGSVGVSVAVNAAGARTGTLTIAGQTFTVMQNAVVGP